MYSAESNKSGLQMILDSIILNYLHKFINQLDNKA